MERAAIAAVLAFLSVAMWPAFLNGSVFWTDEQDSKKWVVGAENFSCGRIAERGGSREFGDDRVENRKACRALLGLDGSETRPYTGGGGEGARPYMGAGARLRL
jgi:hypothetical protein